MNNYKKFLTKTKKLFSCQPLSMRAVLTIFISAICLFYYGKNQSDLIALTIGTTIFLCLFVSIISIVCAFNSVFKPFKNFNDFSSPQENFFSQNFNSAPIFLPSIKIAPFFYLNIKRVFENEQLNKNISFEHTLKGTFTKNNYQSIVDQLYFNHRGEYKQTGFYLTFKDALGLTRISKFISSPRVFKVSPKEREIRPLPIMAASAQLGDVEHSNLDRTGDLFDIREYQPGDSLKRVLWKVYARSSNVVVRHPEPAIVPEGEVAIFVLAKLNQDDVAASSLSYLKILEDQNIIFSLSCLGNNTHEIAKSLDEANELIIKKALTSDEDLGESFKTFIEAIEKNNFRAKKIIIFLSKDYLNTNNLTDTDISLLNKISLFSEQNILSLSLALVPKHQKFIYEQKNLGSSFLEKLDQKINNLKCLTLLNISNIFSKFSNSKKNKNTLSRPEIFNQHPITEVNYADL
jgi:hypothetical protein